MDLLETKIQVNKKAYNSFTNMHMSDSLEDAYNDFLAQFTSRKIDPQYNDFGHQYLQKEDGDTYYFDSFKYIYPSDNCKNLMQVLNSNVGRDKVNIVEYTGTAILTKNWDFSNQSVDVTSYFITDDTREYIDKAYGQPISMGFFLLQVSGNSINAIESMARGETIQIRKYDEKIIVTDSNGDVIEEDISLSNNSFYKEVQDTVNYDRLLNQQYKKGHAL